jgi:hypothetical protein
MQRATPTESKRTRAGRGPALLALAACLFVPSIAQAQDKGTGSNGGDSSAKSGSPASGLTDKRVSVDADNTRLSEALATIMKSAGADFVVDNALKNATVSVHLTNIRFQVALDTLVKVCSEPVTYKIEDGVYHFIPRVGPPDPPSTSTAPSAPKGPSYKIGKIVVQNADAQELVDFLSGDSSALDGTPSSVGSTGDISGFRSYSSSGFLNGRPFSSSYSAPITNSNNGYNNGSYRSSYSSGGGISFGPIGFGPGGFHFNPIHFPGSGGGIR